MMSTKLIGSGDLINVYKYNEWHQQQKYAAVIILVK